MDTNPTWFDPRLDPPAERTMYFFHTKSDDLVLIGFFVAPIPGYAYADGYLGCFTEGIWQDYRPLRGIGYNLWAQNEYEVTHYTPLILPDPPKKGNVEILFSQKIYSRVKNWGEITE